MNDAQRFHAQAELCLRIARLMTDRAAADQLNVKAADYLAPGGSAGAASSLGAVCPLAAHLAIGGDTVTAMASLSTKMIEQS